MRRTKRDRDDAAIAELYDGLDQWAFGDIEKAARSGAHRLAFIGAACLLDVLVMASTRQVGEEAWIAFFNDVRFVPGPLHGAGSVLYGDFRSRLVHNYGTKSPGLRKGVGLIDGCPEVHAERVDGRLILNLESFLEGTRTALDAVFAVAQTDDLVRRGLIKASTRVIRPVPIKGSSMPAGVKLQNLPLSVSAVQ